MHEIYSLREIREILAWTVVQDILVLNYEIHAIKYMLYIYTFADQKESWEDQRLQISKVRCFHYQDVINLPMWFFMLSSPLLIQDLCVLGIYASWSVYMFTFHNQPMYGYLLQVIFSKDISYMLFRFKCKETNKHNSCS